MKILRFILLFTMTICIALFACGSAVAIFGLHSNWYSFNQNWLYFIIGFMAFTALVVSFYIFWQKHILSGVTRQFLFFHKLNHEVIHAITAMLTLSGVYSINVSASGGSVETGGKSPLNFVVALAPYLISLPLILMLAYILLGATLTNITFFFLGFAFCYHVCNVLFTSVPCQTDFSSTTYPIGLIWIVSALVIVSSIVAATVAGGKAYVSVFTNRALIEMFNLNQFVIEYVRAIILK